MNINCVIVSVNYGDILAHTLPHIKHLFKRTLVITDTKDESTVSICKNYQVEYLQTDVFYEKGSKFDKGAGISEGLQYLGVENSEDWFLQLDADIWLHPFNLTQLNNLRLNPQCIYGCDRIMIESFTDWIKFYENPNLWNNEFWLLELNKFKVGSRLTFYYGGDSWNVLGYFQLWNPKSSGIKYYPSFNDASSSDIVFSQLFSRSRRILIPELIAVHLENCESLTGSNWKGRTTPKFSI